jgi:hypothetical protein
MPRTRGRLRPIIENYYPHLSKPVNRLLVRSVVQGRQLCGGDLDKLLVLQVIILRMNEHPDYPELLPGEMLTGKVDPLPALPVSVQSIADITDIPRESVRRKVGELVRAGWVERIGTSHLLRLTPRGYVDIHPLRETFISLVTECVVTTDHILAERVSR